MKPENFVIPTLPRRTAAKQLVGGLLLALAAGLLFALGLLLSGMTQPAKVIGFLNLAGLAQGEFPGAWDPSLAFVMGGAVMVTLLAFRLTPARASQPQRRPWFSSRFELPQQERIDAPLLQGAVIFGVGWGLAGYCPGPALATLLVGGRDVWLFVPAMLVGMWLARRMAR
ncbi:YeeE/YedE family protein [Malikia spinosa]|uniref:YeeE/YedE family protein n=1 Tax=Malikia spinosa TaxID=86180 RepID=UPI000AA120FE|nr:YeeE/YedE family protein [Malikia spinosa]